ncbi:MAG: protein kinase, partial [Ellagibacter isourolithinifaciens]|uniref:protein kinase n=1 Tax=Ellagibacter isourolithinifaciens TaxID=2137581 RepID=UPI0023F1DA33
MAGKQLILDRYRPMSEAGAGGFATVQVAWDTQMRRKVAIKCIELPKASPDSLSRVAPAEQPKAARHARAEGEAAPSAPTQVVRLEDIPPWEDVPEDLGEAMSSALAALPEDLASGLGSDRAPVGPGGFENPEGPEDFCSPDEFASDIPGLAEARTIAQFSDANIVTVYNFEVKDSTAYLIMEYVEGTTLERFLREHDGDLT